MNLQKTLLLSPALMLIAHAGPLVFNMTISGADTGSIVISETAGLIGTITGMFDGSTVTGILPTGSIGINDNLLYLTSPYLDGGGLSFQLATIDTQGYAFVNLSWNTVQSAYFSEQSPTSANMGGVAFGPDAVTLTSVPEPGSASLLLVAAGFALALRKRLTS
jgi:hypothetical protein